MHKRLLAIVALATLSATLTLAQSTNHPPRRNFAPPGVKAVKDLEYGRAGSRALLLDLYLPEKTDKPLPLIIWVHGGGWQNGSKDNSSPALGFTRQGYAVAHVGYRLSQEAQFPAQIYDCKAAVRWLRANAAKYHLDPDRFIAWGGSAGGHLVALLGTTGGLADLEGSDNDLKTSSRVQAVIDWYGPTDFRPNGRARTAPELTSSDGPVAKLLGGPAAQNPDKAAKASPMTYISHGDPPFLIMHGDQDHTVPVQQSISFAEALKKAGTDVTLVIMNGSGHGFKGPEAIDPVQEFLEHCFKK